MMMDEGCYFNRRIFNLFVYVYCILGDFFYVYKLLKKMEDCGCEFGYLVYNILIGGICSKVLLSLDDLELVEKVYGEMFNVGSVLNKINVSKFCRCFCEFGKFDKVYNIIYEMMNKGFVFDCSIYFKVIEFFCNGLKV